MFIKGDIGENKDSISKQIKEMALQVGFSDCGITDSSPLLDYQYYLQSWLEKGYNGSMQYMENYFDKRLNPSFLVEDAKSVVVILLNYKQPKTIPDSLPQVAQYAYGMDYHIVMKQKMYQLLSHIQEIVECNGVVFVDTAPVLEKALAVKAGLGWIGKNSLLINPKYGSRTFIGTIFLDIPLHYNDKIVKNGCGKCQRCIDNCPAHAIIAPGRIKADSCISYLNKTHKGEPTELDTNWIFGCDECINACPYNKNTPTHNIDELMPLDKLFEIDLSTISRSKLRKIVMRRKK